MRYLVRLEGWGLNFLVLDRVAKIFGFLGVGKRITCAGFYATRHVSASSLEEAVELAKIGIVDELVRQGLVDQKSSMKLEFRTDEVHELEQANIAQSPKGFSFYKSRNQ